MSEKTEQLVTEQEPTHFYSSTQCEYTVTVTETRRLSYLRKDEHGAWAFSRHEWLPATEESTRQVLSFSCKEVDLLGLLKFLGAGK